MKNAVTAAGVNWARRHPRQVGESVRFAARHRHGVTHVVRTTRRASRLLSQLDHTAADPAVQHEARLAASALSRAVRRSRRLGLARALDDHQVIDQLKSTAEHASNLIAAAERPVRRAHHRPRRRKVGLASAVVVGAVAYAGWRASLHATA